jgi:hypothetical protein
MEHYFSEIEEAAIQKIMKMGMNICLGKYQREA